MIFLRVAEIFLKMYKGFKNKKKHSSSTRVIINLFINSINNKNYKLKFI